MNAVNRKPYSYGSKHELMGKKNNEPNNPAEKFRLAGSSRGTRKAKILEEIERGPRRNR